MAEYFLYFLIAFVVYLNLLSTVSLIKAKDLTGLQKLGQVLFSWLIPLFGAKFVLHMLSESEPKSTKWIPHIGHGWLIIANTYHDSSHGNDNASFSDFSSGDAGGND